MERVIRFCLEHPWRVILAVAAVMGMYWLYMAWSGYKAVDDSVWARKLFVFSIFTITALSVMMSLDFQVPHELLLTYAP